MGTSNESKKKEPNIRPVFDPVTGELIGYERDRFPFYLSWFITAQHMPEELRLQYLEGICDYALNGKKVAEDSPVYVHLINPYTQIKMASEKALNGSKGGRPSKNGDSESQAEEKPDFSKMSGRDIALFNSRETY